ncbi:MAG TPA: glycosyltransferase [Burkholderiaceae bacterium]|nr:glycosyltransferase [Burkholderiaceae bacterium]
MARPDTLQIAQPAAEPLAESVARPRGAMHVVHVTEPLTESVLAFLVRVIAELDDLGLQQTLVFTRRPETSEEVFRLLQHRVRLIELPPATGWHIDFARALTKALQELAAAPGPLAVHLHAANTGLIGRFAIATLRGRAACFYTPHGLPLLNPRRPVARAIAWALERLAGRLPIAPVGYGVGEARVLASVCRRPAFVLEHPIDDVFFEVRHAETTPPVVITTGRAAEHNAPELFAHLALRFEIDESPTSFVWAGGGDVNQEALLRAGGVRVTGRLSPHEIAHALSSAAIYVQTSFWEGMPLSVIHAMAVGLPCVVSNVVGHRDVLVHGKTGFLVRDLEDLERHVRWLLEEPELRQRLGAAARREALSRFSREHFRAALRQLYGVGRTR